MKLSLQWIGVLGGPLVWFAYLQINYMLVPSACLASDKKVLGIVTVVALLGALGAVVSAWRAWHEAGATAETEEGGPIGRSRFMALSGLGLSTLFVLVLLASAVPIVFLGACD
jgi:hypothetical protein